MVDHQALSYSIPATINTSVFRAYDIRGPVEASGITVDLAYAIGLAVGSEARAHRRDTVIVGYDGRLSAPQLQPALVQGLVDSGCDVIDIGQVPTPLVYFATHHLDTDTGVMLTASHNPGHHNGFKIVMAGKTLSTAGVQGLLSRIQQKDMLRGQGKVGQVNIIQDYISAITDRVKLKRPLKIVVDAGNGIAGAIAPVLYRALGCEVIELFCEVDGHFPNHHPDPTIMENLQDSIAAVQTEQADIGLAFDGDADRIGVVTDQGEVIWPDRQMMLYAIDVLAKHPGSPIVFDVKCSKQLADVIREHGGEPVMYRTGHSILKAKMLEIAAPLAGEMSGHVFFNDDWYGFDDGLYVGARLLEIIAAEDPSCSARFSALPNSVNTPELKLPLDEASKSVLMERLLTEADFGDGERITIDGLRVEFSYGWGLIRPSNTSPCLVLRFEADTVEHLQVIQDCFRQQLLRLDPSLVLPM